MKRVRVDQDDGLDFLKKQKTSLSLLERTLQHSNAQSLFLQCFHQPLVLTNVNERLKTGIRPLIRTLSLPNYRFRSQEPIVQDAFLTLYPNLQMLKLAHFEVEPNIREIHFRQMHTIRLYRSKPSSSSPNVHLYFADTHALDVCVEKSFGLHMESQALELLGVAPYHLQPQPTVTKLHIHPTTAFESCPLDDLFPKLQRLDIHPTLPWFPTKLFANLVFLSMNGSKMQNFGNFLHLQELHLYQCSNVWLHQELSFPALHTASFTGDFARFAPTRMYTPNLKQLKLVSTSDKCLVIGNSKWASQLEALVVEAVQISMVDFASSCHLTHVQLIQTNHYLYGQEQRLKREELRQAMLKTDSKLEDVCACLETCEEQLADLQDQLEEALATQSAESCQTHLLHRLHQQLLPQQTSILQFFEQELQKHETAFYRAQQRVQTLKQKCKEQRQLCNQLRSQRALGLQHVQQYRQMYLRQQKKYWKALRDVSVFPVFLRLTTAEQVHLDGLVLDEHKFHMPQLASISFVRCLCKSTFALQKIFRLESVFWAKSHLSQLVVEDMPSLTTFTCQESQIEHLQLYSCHALDSLVLENSSFVRLLLQQLPSLATVDLRSIAQLPKHLQFDHLFKNFSIHVLSKFMSQIPKELQKRIAFE